MLEKKFVDTVKELDPEVVIVWDYWEKLGKIISKIM
jgi:hypothetical protein